MADARAPAWLRFDTPPPDDTGRDDGGAVTVDGSATRTRAGLFDALADVLELPDHFGRNWDALADVLADRLDTGPLTLVVRDAGHLLAEEPPAQLGTLLDVLGGVDAGARESLRVVLRDTAEPLSGLRRQVTSTLAGVPVPPASPGSPPIGPGRRAGEGGDRLAGPQAG
ncbi:barstar family protein [Micromonospora sp. ATA51]|uniref:barstar family protein n=1 Tax=Micromonospora sp. ATA51 TaxID=2806098 RepID=UPI001A36E015|nr:barstar family protein [Micromonospora sp. ATA51]MBM0225227.1 barstar family protein [Micromonospora sp. ATA51]